MNLRHQSLRQESLFLYNDYLTSPWAVFLLLDQVMAGAFVLALDIAISTKHSEIPSDKDKAFKAYFYESNLAPEH